MFDSAGRALKVLSAAQRSGAVAGGGAAFVHAARAVQSPSLSGEAAFGATLLVAALAAPLQQIARNSGVESPASVVAHVRDAGNGFTFDAHSRKVVAARTAGILDAAEVAVATLLSAASCALMALSTDTIVYHAHPQQSFEP